MKNFLQVGLMSALLVGSIATTAANAQGFYVRSHIDSGRHLGWYDRDRDFGFRRFVVRPGEVAAFNNRVANLRNDIARRMSRGIIGPNEATRLNTRLDRLVALENQFQASGGGITASEMASLNTRLNNDRVAIMGSGRWF